jgi:hypothetical protein
MHLLTYSRGWRYPRSVADTHTAPDHRFGDDGAVASNLNVVSDMHEVVDP